MAPGDEDARSQTPDPARAAGALERIGRYRVRCELDFGIATSITRSSGQTAGGALDASAFEDAGTDLDEPTIATDDTSAADTHGGESTDPTSATGRGGITGTPGYMSPEQLRGTAVDARTDLFAFGCVLLEALTGMSAFSGADAVQRAMATLQSEPDLTALPEDTPPAIRELILRCLAKSPSDRRQSSPEVRRILADSIEARRLERALARRSEARSGGGNLPRSLTPFVGRKEEIRDLEALLRKHSLVTITGIGGIGKTRLAIAVAETWTGSDGAWYVDLAPVAAREKRPSPVTRATSAAESGSGERRAPASARRRPVDFGSITRTSAGSCADPATVTSTRDSTWWGICTISGSS